MQQKHKVCVRDILGNSTPATGSDKIQPAACWSWKTVDQSVDSSAIEGETSFNLRMPNTICVCGDDSPQQAIPEITDAVHYCLQSLQKCRYVTDHVSSISSRSQITGSEISK
jgi:hypothetical protein